MRIYSFPSRMVRHIVTGRSRIISGIRHHSKQHTLDTQVLGQLFGSIRKPESLEVNIVGPLENPPNAEGIFFSNFLTHGEDDFEKVHGCSTLLRALRDTRMPLQCLKFGSSSVRFFEQKPLAIRRLEGALEHLETLLLTTYLVFARYSDGILSNKKFGLLRRSAPRLKRLHICLAPRWVNAQKFCLLN